MIDCPALHNKSKNYPARFAGRVPKTVRTLRTIQPDAILLMTIPDDYKGVIAEHSCLYPAWTNSHGAVAAVMDNGRKLGLKPDEFEVVEWH